MTEEIKDTTGQDDTEPAVEEKEEIKEPAEEKVETKEDVPNDEPEGSEKKEAPEKYDLKLSEDSGLDASDIERISAYAKERGLSNEAAQELVEREESAINSYRDAQMQEVEEIRAKWLEDSESDKEIGGENFTKNVELAKRVVDRFGSDSFKETLKETGFGNHPEVVRVFVRIGKAMAEDTLVTGKSTGRTRKDGMDILFPTTAQQ